MDPLRRWLGGVQAIGIAVLAAASASTIRADEPRFEKLDNGLRICIVEDRALPLVHVQLWFRGGSVLDPPDRYGLTHVTRELLLRRAAIEGGAVLDVESHTLPDACFLAATILTASIQANPGGEAESERQHRDPLERTLRGLARAVQRSPVSEEEWQRAFDGVAARSAPDAEPAAVTARLRDRLFAGHPYRRPPEAVSASIRTLPSTVIDEHIERWFAPAQATLFLSGSVTAEAALALVRRHFGDIPWCDVARRADFESPPVERIRIATDDASRETGRLRFSVAWVTPPLDTPDEAGIHVLVQRLCNAVDGPLRRRIIEMGWTAPMWSIDSWQRAGMLRLTTFGPDDDAHRATRGEPAAEAIAAAIDEELIRAATAPPTEVELNRARNLAVLAALRLRETPTARARRAAEHEIVGGDILLIEYELPRVRRLAAGDLMFAAGQLSEARRVTLLDRVPHGPDRPVADSRPAMDAAGSTAALDRLVQACGLRPSVLEVGRGITLEGLWFAGLDTASVRGAWVARGGSVPAGAIDAIRRRAVAGDLSDYLSYHGLAVDVTGSGIEAWGSADQLDRLLEVVLRIGAEAHGGSESPFRLRIVADREPAMLVERVREAGSGGAR